MTSAGENGRSSMNTTPAISRLSSHRHDRSSNSRFNQLKEKIINNSEEELKPMTSSVRKRKSKKTQEDDYLAIDVMRRNKSPEAPLPPGNVKVKLSQNSIQSMVTSKDKFLLGKSKKAKTEDLMNNKCFDVQEFPVHDEKSSRSSRGRIIDSSVLIADMNDVEKVSNPVKSHNTESSGFELLLRFVSLGTDFSFLDARLDAFDAALTKHFLKDIKDQYRKASKDPSIKRKPDFPFHIHVNDVFGEDLNKYSHVVIPGTFDQLKFMLTDLSHGSANFFIQVSEIEKISWLDFDGSKLPNVIDEIQERNRKGEKQKSMNKGADINVGVNVFSLGLLISLKMKKSFSVSNSRIVTCQEVFMLLSCNGSKSSTFSKIDEALRTLRKNQLHVVKVDTSSIQLKLYYVLYSSCLQQSKAELDAFRRLTEDFLKWNASKRKLKQSEEENSDVEEPYPHPNTTLGESKTKSNLSDTVQSNKLQNYLPKRLTRASKKIEDDDLSKTLLRSRKNVKYILSSDDDDDNGNIFINSKNNEVVELDQSQIPSDLNGCISEQPVRKSSRIRNLHSPDSIHHARELLFSLSARNEASKIYCVYPATFINFEKKNGQIEILNGDLERLNDTVFLNDTLISFYLKYLVHGVYFADNKCSVFSTYFFQRLTKSSSKAENKKTYKQRVELNLEAVERWTKNENIFEKRFVIIPINQHLHWSLVVIANLPLLPKLLEKVAAEIEAKKLTKPKLNDDSVEIISPINRLLENVDKSESSSVSSTVDTTDFFDDTQELPCILFLDSLSSTSGERICSIVLEYIKLKFHASNLSIPDDILTAMFNKKRIPFVFPKVPSQVNSYDCGVFVLKYCEILLKLEEQKKLFFSKGNLTNKMSTVLKEDLFDPDKDIWKKREDIANLLKDLHKKYRANQKNCHDIKDCTESASDDDLEIISPRQDARLNDMEQKIQSAIEGNILYAQAHLPSPTLPVNNEKDDADRASVTINMDQKQSFFAEAENIKELNVPKRGLPEAKHKESQATIIQIPEVSPPELHRSPQVDGLTSPPTPSSIGSQMLETLVDSRTEAFIEEPPIGFELDENNQGLDVETV